MARLLKSLLGGRAKDKPLTYHEAKDLAGHDDPEVRRKLAARVDVKPEILFFLAEDPVIMVRRTVAANPAAPHHADLVLARDDDPEVREDLANKIASLAPGLSADEQDRVKRMAYEALGILVRDQVTRVRQILSETLKDVADAPPEVIRQLAWDAELVVAGPVLRFSPVLSDDDLLEIIEAKPAKGGVGAIAQRDGISASVVDAVVADDDEDAVALLLGNPSAQIREETLDRIIDRAPDVESWHPPLVTRPVLPAKAAGRLARFVADHLPAALSERRDLEPAALDAVRAAVDRRLEGNRADTPGAGPQSTADEALKSVTELHDKGRLDEPAVAKALQNGDNELVVAALAVLSGLKVAVVRKVMSNNSAKGVVALVWKANLSADLALVVQQKLARIPHKDLLRPHAGGAYALGQSDLEWQAEFIEGLGT